MPLRHFLSFADLSRAELLSLLDTARAMKAGQNRATPLTGKQVMPAKHVPELLAIMATAGFYDESGDWMYTAGLPAKTGVGGGIVAVVPGRFAIAAFSPRLNEAGNSVRSLKAIRDIAGELGVGVFGPNPN